MDKTAPTWSMLQEPVQVVLAAQHLKRTVCVALIVGTVFFSMNQLGVILHGRATAVVWVKIALTYLTPLLVSKFRASVGDTTAYCPAHLTIGAMSGNPDHHRPSRS